MIETLLQVGLWVAWGFLIVVCGGSILLCWACFFYAWCRGELTDDTTPMQILEGIERRLKATP